MKGVSPVISFVMLFGIVLVAAATIWLWARPLVEEVGEKGRITNLENQMLLLNSFIRDCARGDYNFTQQIRLYIPRAYIDVDYKWDRIRLVFEQKQLIIGVPNPTQNTVCNDTTQFVYDNSTYITLYKKVGDVYIGSVGAYGRAEIMICYPDIDIVRGVCGPSASNVVTVIIRKVGYNESSEKPMVEVDVC